MKPPYGIQSKVQGWPYNLLSKPGHFRDGKGKLFTVMSESGNRGCPRTQWHSPVEPEVELAATSPGRLLKHRLLDSTPKVLCSVALGSKLCLSDKFIGGSIIPHLGTAVSELLFSLDQLGTLMLMMYSWKKLSLVLNPSQPSTCEDIHEEDDKKKTCVGFALTCVPVDLSILDFPETALLVPTQPSKKC